MEATQSIATLMITQATATMEQGKQVFLFDKVKVPEGKTGTWFVQGDKRTCDQSHHWLNTQMVAKLAAWFGNDKDKADERLNAVDIGPLVRTNSTRDKSVSGNVASVEDRVAEKYIATMKSTVKPSAPPAPPQPTAECRSQRKASSRTMNYNLGRCSIGGSSSHKCSRSDPCRHDDLCHSCNNC